MCPKIVPGLDLGPGVEGTVTRSQVFRRKVDPTSPDRDGPLPDMVSDDLKDRDFPLFRHKFVGLFRMKYSSYVEDSGHTNVLRHTDVLRHERTPDTRTVLD